LRFVVSYLAIGKRCHADGRTPGSTGGTCPTDGARVAGGKRDCYAEG
jgi:hypothetical protein